MDTYEDYLVKKADEYGFHETLKKQWISYMRDDVKRGRQLLGSLMGEVGLKEYQCALDIGSGFGGLCVALKERFDYVSGIEIVKERVEWSRIRAPGCDIRHGTAVHLPYPDASFDFIVSTDVFEHIPLGDQHHAAAEISRVLKKGAKGYIEVPNKFQMLDEHNKVWFGTYLPPTVRRIYTTALTKNKKYLQCWERTRRSWCYLFETPGLKTHVVPYAYPKKWFPPNRFKIYLEKPANPLKGW